MGVQRAGLQVERAGLAVQELEILVEGRRQHGNAEFKLRGLDHGFELRRGVGRFHVCEERVRLSIRESFHLPCHALMTALASRMIAPVWSSCQLVSAHASHFFHGWQ